MNLQASFALFQFRVRTPEGGFPGVRVSVLIERECFSATGLNNLPSHGLDRLAQGRRYEKT